MNFKKRDIISIEDLSKDDILKILKVAKKMEKNPVQNILKGKIMATLFFEPSTRTRLSFESSMKRLGGEILGFGNPKITSVTKGETLWDTTKMIQAYCDVIVIRHYLEGAARLSAESADVPVINAGDGSNQHPTQTMLDLFTIEQSQGKIKDLHIAMCGDLKYGRTVHSLTKALSLFNPTLYFVSPDTLRIPGYIRHELRTKKIKFSEHTDINEVMNKIDILYATRIQKERFPDLADYEKVKNTYILKKNMLGGAKDNMKIMHPLPRVNEIDNDVDDTKHAYYFQQAANAVPIRQAIISLVLGAEK
ncbi:aspartate carbamoyltransferase [archaeon]|jgi:aspartate carbamoyltransferase catalytic subunit|nr:aspartate carbamoyltransferase [archaeon]MBT4351534.1 aspartate carbamoyltransferase [archaeon]MBT4647695.1 aspartate carbamoyltransferase [archaeon]MBT6822367.1 aspartate carbamoyltransferase [archaeon]MBT7391320.1 aspartate carbamoyltransferase [archaeon]